MHETEAASPVHCHEARVVVIKLGVLLTSARIRGAVDLQPKHGIEFKDAHCTVAIGFIMAKQQQLRTTAVGSFIQSKICHTCTDNDGLVSLDFDLLWEHIRTVFKTSWKGGSPQVCTATKCTVSNGHHGFWNCD